MVLVLEYRAFPVVYRGGVRWVCSCVSVYYSSTMNFTYGSQNADM